MRKLLIAVLCILELQFSNAQTETHDFITYDTLINLGYANLTYRLRITRPRNLFTSNHPDTASRPAIITMPGQGEMGTDYAKLRTHGPHYWLYRNQNHVIDSARGWDGGVSLGNGKHYPILITMISSSTWPGARENYLVLKYLIDRYHIKKNAVHLGGLSQGAFTWSSMIAYEETAGAETGMKIVTSLTLLQGTASELPNPYASWSRGFNAFGVWARKYNGKLFGLEGNFDGRDVWRAQVPMNNNVPGSAYFAFENIGGGGHCCWNSMYDPNRTNFSSVGTLALNIVNNLFHPNSMGSYQAGDHIFKWMLKQGDTSLVGSGTTPPVAPPVVLTVSAGSDQSLTLPVNSASLTGSGAITNGSPLAYLWTKVSGGAATITNPSLASTTVTGLSQGVYVFRLTTSDGGSIKSDDVQVTVAGAQNVLPVSNAGGTKTITLPVNTVSLSGSGSDADGSITAYNWSKKSGGSFSITSPTSASTTITGLEAGTYVFSLSVTDNRGGESASDVTIFVNPAIGTNAKQIPGKIEAEQYDAFYGVQAENTTDSGRGQNVGYINMNDWMDYYVNVATTGSYSIRLRLAAIASGAKIQLRKGDGTVLGTVDVPVTGGYQSWINVTTQVSLTAGSQTIRLFSLTSVNWNINWMNFSAAPVAPLAPAQNVNMPVTAISTRIEAESYSTMNGVQKEFTNDVNGGINLGYIDLYDWMEYPYNAPVTGVYTINFRVAAPLAGAQLQLKKGDGSILSTLTLPQTGGYQLWQTASVTVPLEAGQQVIKVYSSSNINWNFNWLEIVPPAEASPESATVRMMAMNAEMIGESDNEKATEVLFSAKAYPNPAVNNVMLEVNSIEKGMLNVRISDISGKVVKELRVVKNAAGSFRVNIAVDGWKQGLYFVNTTIGNFSKTLKILKQ
ncbi:MAG: carbohydrate-binding protein [Chitinophagaceae bacterium]|nr:carbohydrate-binding protein [Chitinophagaceae bacterium]